jgi:hypothetical protein
MRSMKITIYGATDYGAAEIASSRCNQANLILPTARSWGILKQSRNELLKAQSKHPY